MSRSAGTTGALPGPRVGRTSRRATAGLRWMTVAAGDRGTELGNSLVSTPPPGSAAPQKCMYAEK
jgi:hypothetical protein